MLTIQLEGKKTIKGNVSSLYERLALFRPLPMRVAAQHALIIVPLRKQHFFYSIVHIAILLSSNGKKTTENEEETNK
jgi:hypothetical protein